MGVNNMQTEVAMEIYIAPAADAAAPHRQNQGLIIQ